MTTPSESCASPAKWEHVTSGDLLSVYRSEAWPTWMVLSDFERVLSKLRLDRAALGRKLFEALGKPGTVRGRMKSRP